MSEVYFSGIDLGSTTVKLVVSKKDKDNQYNIVFNRYKRHHAKVRHAVHEILSEAVNELGNFNTHLAITGSAGMGLAEDLEVPFLQEVVSSAEMIKTLHKDIKTFIEIGGEDSKIIFFDDNFRADMRMNGACAGGTGAFIDQISVLLDIPVEEFNNLAKKATRVYPIASRCGVFAKTDVQSLLSNNVPKEDIALSAFHAVALQVLSTLTRGKDIESKILLAGGPLTFNSELRKAFIELISEHNKEDFIIPENPELVPATGCAIKSEESPLFDSSELIDKLEKSKSYVAKRTASDSSLPQLFKDENEYSQWVKSFEKYKVDRFDYTKGGNIDCVLGVDSGSTTTKVILIDTDGKVIFTHYENNKGKTLEAVRRGLEKFKAEADKYGLKINIIQSAATGYGEGLIKAAYGLDYGVVETMAHFRAACEYDPDVSFIMDIGGQDMKAMFIRDERIADIQVNEACSSGCGSFIETFANNMNYSVQEFAEEACKADRPYDLGTRCTVFMNTKVKQALRENVTVPNISSGLSFSVIKNSLYKVLKLTDTKILGNKILVQGGTFKNNSVLRAFELLLEKEVIRPDIPELMGAFGSALIALDKYKKGELGKTTFEGLSVLDRELNYSTRYLQCKGCENKCQIVKMTFENGNPFYTGNKCEKIFTNSARETEPGKSLVNEKLDMLFKRTMVPGGKKKQRIGIPRVLNMFANFPFWNSLLVESGFEVVLSDKSNIEIFENGVKSVMSENICFPAKVAHGHILNLVNKKVDRIFFPHVVFENDEFKETVNSFNCPVVTGYPDVIKSSINPEKRYGIPVDNPPISFKNEKLLRKQIIRFMRKLGVSEKTVKKAFAIALEKELKFKSALENRALEIIREAEEKNKPLIVLAGRPYHIDQLINHGVPEILTELGAYVVTEDSLPLSDTDRELSDIQVLTQWGYTNRLYAAAKWVAAHPTAQLVQLTSFGCGPDCVSVDEVKSILDSAGKIYTVIKLDEVFNIGAAKIRLRSMMEAIKKRPHAELIKERKKKEIFPTQEEIASKTVIIPYFSKFHSELIPYAFKGLGVNVVNLPEQNEESITYGIKNINNEMCYPAILIAGDIIKAFQTGMYDKENTIVMLSSTGGQCRASNYVALIRKSLEKAGLGEIPIDIFSTKSFKNLIGDPKKQRILMKRLALGMLISDPLAEMYLTMRPREKHVGTCKALQTKYFKVLGETIVNGTYKDALKVLKEAVQEFNNIEIKSDPIPRIGMVGEIFVKYNSFAHMDITEWLSDQGIEVVLPPLQSFFLQEFVNQKYKYKNYFADSYWSLVKLTIIDTFIQTKSWDVNKIMKKFKFYRKPHNIHKAAKKAEKVTSLANQFGEGWLLTSDILSMLDDGVDQIISVQPFGCLANHIVAKGVERKITEKYPNFLLLTLDFDQSTSPVNIFNRLHFLVSSAKEHYTGK